jgi:hypothetical protein
VDRFVVFSIAVALAVVISILTYSFPFWLSEIGPSGIITLGLTSAIFENVLIATLVFGLVAHFVRRADARKKEEARQRAHERQLRIQKEEEQRQAQLEAEKKRAEHLRKTVAEASIKASAAVIKAASYTAIEIDKAVKITRKLHEYEKSGASDQKQLFDIRRQMFVAAVGMEAKVDTMLAGHEFKSHILADILFRDDFESFDLIVASRETMQQLRHTVSSLRHGAQLVALEEKNVIFALNIFYDILEASASTIAAVAADIKKNHSLDNASRAFNDLATGIKGLVRHVREDLEDLSKPLPIA